MKSLVHGVPWNYALPNDEVYGSGAGIVQKTAMISLCVKLACMSYNDEA